MNRKRGARFFEGETLGGGHRSVPVLSLTWPSLLPGPHSYLVLSVTWSCRLTQLALPLSPERGWGGFSQPRRHAHTGYHHRGDYHVR
jgi:hypothetical protein